MITKETDILIEGFPRSANTYAVLAFQYNNPEVKVAHHLHVPAQLDCALKYKIPSLILIRNPEDAIRSMLVREPTYTLQRAIEEYHNFYSLVLKNKDTVFIADFSDVISKFDVVMEKLNKKYHTDFRIFQNTVKNNEEIQNKIKVLSKTSDKKAGENGLAIPSEKKENLKSQISISKDELVSCMKLYEECIG